MPRDLLPTAPDLSPCAVSLPLDHSIPTLGGTQPLMVCGIFRPPLAIRKSERAAFQPLPLVTTFHMVQTLSRFSSTPPRLTRALLRAVMMAPLRHSMWLDGAAFMRSTHGGPTSRMLCPLTSPITGDVWRVVSLDGATTSRSLVRSGNWDHNQRSMPQKLTPLAVGRRSDRALPRQPHRVGCAHWARP